MIPLNAITVFASRAHPDVRPGSAAVPERATDLTLGFADVRSHGASADVEPRRRSVGFSPPDIREPSFRTEVSFRPHLEDDRSRVPAPVPFAQVPTWDAPDELVLPFATSVEPVASATEVGEKKVPFYKREITFRRRRDAEPLMDEPETDEAAEGEELEEPRAWRPFGFTSELEEETFEEPEPLDPLTSDDEASRERKVPFYKRELTFRRHAPEPTLDEPEIEEAPLEPEPFELLAGDDDGSDAKKVPFYKRELSFRRRRGVEPVAEEPEADSSDEPVSKPFGFTSEPEDSERQNDEEAEDADEAWVVPAVVAAEEEADQVDEPASTEAAGEEADVEEVLVESEPVELFGASGAEDDGEPELNGAPEPDAVEFDDDLVAEESFPETEPVPELAEPEPQIAYDEYDEPRPVLSFDDEEEHEVPSPATNGRRSRRLGRGGSPSLKRERTRRSRGGRRIVGLKIGASQLAAAVVAEVDGANELVQLARSPLESGVVVDGEVRDSVALVHALKTFFEEHKLSRRDVRIGLASNRIGVRTFDIVGIDDPERFDNAVRFKAHEVLPVAVHESVLDYRVLEERVNETGEPMRRVLLVVAPRDQLEPYLEVCSEAGLKLAGVDLEALGLLRAFVEPRPFVSRTGDETATVIVAIGHEATTLLVAGGGACEFTRVFDWGGGVLQNAVAQELDVPLVEAATILRHLSLSGEPKPLASLDDAARVKAMEAVRTRLTPFARELVSSLQFYQTQQESLGIGEIVITGGTSHLQGLADALHQMIGVAVRVGDPLQRVVAHGAFDSHVEAAIGSLAVPIGLAIEDVSMRSVDLMPRELRPQRSKADALKLLLPVAAAVPIVGLGFLFLQANGKVSDRESELAAVRTEIATLPQPKRPSIDQGVAVTEAQRAMALASVLGGRVSWDGVFHDLSLVLPANVSLTRVEAQIPAQLVQATTDGAASTTTPAESDGSSGVKIEGYTDDQPSVARLLARLRAVPSLSGVQLQSSLRQQIGTKKSVVRFVILGDITRPGGTP